MTTTTTLSELDRSITRQIARLLHKALTDIRLDDEEAGELGAGRAIGAADMLTWDIEDVAVKNRAIQLCDHAYRACIDIRRGIEMGPWG